MSNDKDEEGTRPSTKLERSVRQRAAMKRRESEEELMNNARHKRQWPGHDLARSISYVPIEEIRPTHAALLAL